MPCLRTGSWSFSLATIVVLLAAVQDDEGGIGVCAASSTPSLVVTVPPMPSDVRRSSDGTQQTVAGLGKFRAEA